MKRKMIVFLLFCCLVVNVFSGGQQEEKGSEKPAEKVELKFWKGGMDAIYHDYWLDFIDRFESANPNIEIEYAEAPFGQQLDTKLNAAYASGVSPDIISNAISQVSKRSDLGQYEILDPYFDKWSGKSDIQESIVELGRYKGDLTGLAYTPIAEIFAYRKDFFNEAGLDPERTPENWAELGDYAKKLTVKTGNMVERSGWVIPIDGFKIFTAFARELGAELVTPDRLPSFDGPECIETLEFLTELYTDQPVSAEITQKQENQQSLFVLGRAAMAVVQPTWIGRMIKEDPGVKENLGFFLANKNPGGTFCGAHLMHISSESKYKEEAWEFVKASMAKEEMWNRIGATHCTKAIFSVFL